MKGFSLQCPAFALFLITLCLVQSCNCYSDSKWNSQKKKQQSRDVNYYNGFSSNTSISSRDMSVDSSYSPPRDLSSVSLPSIPNIPKPSNIVAYHRSIHNTSWALTIPLFTFLLPTANVGDPVNIGNQALYGFFAAVIVLIGYSVPILFNYQAPTARSLESSKVTLNHLMHPGHLMNLMGVNIGNQIGIDPIQCMQKTICEAYRSPQNERYGMLAWPFQYFFPAKNVSEVDEGAKNIYQLAARDGKYSKTECRKKYECLFDVLDLASYCLSMYKRARNRVKSELAGNQNDLDDSINDKLFFR